MYAIKAINQWMLIALGYYFYILMVKMLIFSAIACTCKSFFSDADITYTSNPGNSIRTGKYAIENLICGCVR